MMMMMPKYIHGDYYYYHLPVPCQSTDPSLTVIEFLYCHTVLTV